MTHFLDANVVIRLINGDPTVAASLRKRQIVPAVSAIVIFELTYGALRSGQVGPNLQRIASFPFPVIEFDNRDARVAGEIRAILAGTGTPIGPYDTLIAGHALSRDLTLVTHNTREFARVPGLRLEDWEA